MFKVANQVGIAATVKGVAARPTASQTRIEVISFEVLLTNLSLRFIFGVDKGERNFKMIFMKSLRQSIKINAPIEKVWDAMRNTKI